MPREPVRPTRKIFWSKWTPPKWCFKTVLGVRGKRLVAVVRPFFWALPIVFFFFVLHTLDVRKQKRLAAIELAKRPPDVK